MNQKEAKDYLLKWFAQFVHVFYSIYFYLDNTINHVNKFPSGFLLFRSCINWFWGDLFFFGFFCWFILTSNNPPVVFLDQIFGTFNDRVKIVSLFIKFAYGMLSLKLCVLNHFEELEFIFSQIGVPKVHDQDQPGLLAIMPSLMLKTIIKNVSFSCNLIPRFLIDS